MPSECHAFHTPQPCFTQDQPTFRNSLQDKTLIPSLGALGRLNRKSPHSLILTVFLHVLVLFAALAFQVFNLRWYLNREEGALTGCFVSGRR